MELLSANSFIIRRAALSDTQAVAQLYHQIWHETQSPLQPAFETSRRTLEFFYDRCTGLIEHCFVCYNQSTLIAFSAWHQQLLGQLFVTPFWRGTDLAAQLLSTSESAMRADGVAIAELHCIKNNHRARRFYEKHSWQFLHEADETVTTPDLNYKIPYWLMQKILS